jgi:uncharacterized protein
MLTDLVQIRRMGERNREDNQRLRQRLKRRTFQERRLKRIAEDVEERIDCTECANCCRVATAKITHRDAEKLAKHIGVSIERFWTDYAEEDPTEGAILKRGPEGCVFLEGNRCGVYDARPASCELFPHLTRGPGSLVSRMWEMPDRACYCPIVYNTLEAWKVDLGFGS